MSIQLIPVSFLKEECFLSDNVDERKYSSHLDDAQEDLRDLLGIEFYDQILSQYSTDPNTLSADNLTLYTNYIKKYLAWQTYFYFLGFSNSDSTPTGEREFNDDNSSVLSDIKMYSKEKNIKSKATRWRDRMINFLRESQRNDSSKYPLWEDECKEYMSFAITSIDKNSDALIRVNKSIITNE
jgi:hypothetical protein